MLEIDGPSLGAVYAVNALAATTITVDALATGTIASGKYIRKFALRANTANPSTERVRVLSVFAAATGVLTHAGASYVDTTATDEFVELHEYDPKFLDDAIQYALRTTRYRHRVSLPMNLSGRYELSDFAWMRMPSDILRGGRQSLAVITPNRHFEGWNGYSTAGALVPDFWTIAGTGATFARSTTVRRGPFSLDIVTTGGNVATVDIVIPVMESGVGADSLRGYIVTGVAVCRGGAASSQRVRVQSENAAGTLLGSAVNSGYHAGNSAWAELSIEHTVNALAEQIRLQFRQETNQASGAQLDELYLYYGSLSDEVRRDKPTITWERHPLPFDQHPAPMLYGPTGRAQQLVIESQRPFTVFDETRVRNGTADGDTSDAPIDLIAHSALARFYGQRFVGADGTPADSVKVEKYRRIAAQLQAQFMVAADESRRGGIELPFRPFGVPALRG